MSGTKEEKNRLLNLRQKSRLQKPDLLLKEIGCLLNPEKKCSHAGRSPDWIKGHRKLKRKKREFCSLQKKRSQKLLMNPKRWKGQFLKFRLYLQSGQRINKYPEFLRLMETLKYWKTFYLKRWSV